MSHIRRWTSPANSAAIPDIIDGELLIMLRAPLGSGPRPLAAGVGSEAEKNIMVGKRHALEEISTKLAEADELAAKGKTQRDIAKALGVSIMTLHRWKKTTGSPVSSVNIGHVENTLDGPSDASPSESMTQLKDENAYLRRLVTDTLVEKMKLEDKLRALQSSHPRRANGRGDRSLSRDRPLSALLERAWRGRIRGEA
jgi:putative transposase